LLDELFLLAPGITLFAFVSSQTGINEHFRYALPTFPFCYIWLGRILGPSTSQSPIKNQPSSIDYSRVLHWTTKLIATVLLAASIASSLANYPHSLSYFNEFIGGPKNGGKHLIHSNLDWGQDIIGLKRWLDQHPGAKPLYVDLLSGFSLSDLRIESQPIPRLGRNDQSATQFTLPAGWYAISVDRLYRSTDPDEPNEILASFLDRPIVHRIGWSIHLYHLPTDEPFPSPHQ
jgi:hypothetical protein